MIDSHCHLADKQFTPDLDDVIDRAKKAGIDRMICIADSMDEAERCKQIAQQYEQISFTVGTHPHVASGFDDTKDLHRMREMAKHPKCKAIGEIGLDYHYMNSPRVVQLGVFEHQLTLAKELNLPAVIHCREAVEDVWAIVNHVKPASLVVHCCTEQWKDVERFVEAGYFLSFTGIATYPKSDVIRDTIKHCPLEQLMIETDSPYLAPVPHRGKRNEPVFVTEVAQCIAQVKDLSIDEVAMQTVENTERFFRL